MAAPSDSSPGEPRASSKRLLPNASERRSRRTRDDPSVVVVLVARARTGDKTAWAELVERYTPLVWSACRRYRLTNMDAADVGQTLNALMTCW
jgi:hypothetical protein